MNQSRFFGLLSRCLLLAGCFIPLSVFADSPWYLGASVGQSAIDASPAEVEQAFLADDAFTAVGSTLDKTDAGGKVYLGYRFNPYLAAEGGYSDLGKATFNTTIIGVPAGSPLPPPFPIEGTATAKGLFLSGLAHLALTQNFSLFAKAGLFRWEAEFSEHIPGTGLTRVSRTEKETDANYGIGLQWQFAPRFGTRLEWERFDNVGKGIGGRDGRDIDFISLGIFIQL